MAIEGVEVGLGAALDVGQGDGAALQSFGAIDVFDFPLGLQDFGLDELNLCFCCAARFVFDGNGIGAGAELVEQGLIGCGHGPGVVQFVAWPADVGEQAAVFFSVAANGLEDFQAYGQGFGGAFEQIGGCGRAAVGVGSRDGIAALRQIFDHQALIACAPAYGGGGLTGSSCEDAI